MNEFAWMGWLYNVSFDWNMDKFYYLLLWLVIVREVNRRKEI